MSRIKTTGHIFNELANRFSGIDPAAVRMISDRCLIKDLEDAEREGLIIIPEAYRERGVSTHGNYRKGVVVSTGPGDRFLEVGIEEWGNEAPRVRRKGLTDGNGASVCVPPQCQPGDVVLYDRRREAEIYLNGERYCLVHAEQSVIAVLDE